MARSRKSIRPFDLKKLPREIQLEIFRYMLDAVPFKARRSVLIAFAPDLVLYSEVQRAFYREAFVFVLIREYGCYNQRFCAPRCLEWYLQTLDFPPEWIYNVHMVLMFVHPLPSETPMGLPLGVSITIAELTSSPRRNLPLNHIELGFKFLDTTYSLRRLHIVNVKLSRLGYVLGNIENLNAPDLCEVRLSIEVDKWYDPEDKFEILNGWMKEANWFFGVSGTLRRVQQSWPMEDEWEWATKELMLDGRMVRRPLIEKFRF